MRQQAEQAAQGAGRAGARDEGDDRRRRRTRRKQIKLITRANREHSTRARASARPDRGDPPHHRAQRAPASSETRGSTERPRCAGRGARGRSWPARPRATAARRAAPRRSRADRARWPSGGFGIFTTDAALVVRTWDDWLAAATGIAARRGRRPPAGRAGARARERAACSTRFTTRSTTAPSQVLAPALHHYLIACPPRTPSARLRPHAAARHIGPLRDERRGSSASSSRSKTSPRGSTRERDAAREATRRGARAVIAQRRLARRARRRSARLARRRADRGRSSRRAASTSLRREHRNFSLLSSALKLLAIDRRRRHGAARRAAARRRCRPAHSGGAGARRRSRSRGGRRRCSRRSTIPMPTCASRRSSRSAGCAPRPRSTRWSAIVESGDFFLAFAALDALAAIDDPRVAPRLVPLLDDETRCACRWPTRSAQLGDDDAVAAAGRGAERSRRAACARSPARSCAFTTATSASTATARGSPIWCATRVAAPAHAALSTPSPRARRDELRALVARARLAATATRSQRALTRLLGEPRSGATSIEALVRHGDRVVDRAGRAARRRRSRHRHAAIVALGRVGEPAGDRRRWSRMLDADGELLVADRRRAGAHRRPGGVRAAAARCSAHPDAGVRQARSAR